MTILKIQRPMYLFWASKKRMTLFLGSLAISCVLFGNSLWTVVTTLGLYAAGYFLLRQKSSVETPGQMGKIQTPEKLATYRNMPIKWDIEVTLEQIETYIRVQHHQIKQAANALTSNWNNNSDRYALAAHLRQEVELLEAMEKAHNVLFYKSYEASGLRDELDFAESELKDEAQTKRDEFRKFIDDSVKAKGFSSEAFYQAAMQEIRAFRDHVDPVVSYKSGAWLRVAKLRKQN